MKYISLFAGIGGFDLALDRLGHEAVYVNEWDCSAAQTYEKNFAHHPDREKQWHYDKKGKRSAKCTGHTKIDIRSIADVSLDEIPNHELLVGGFPCQSFSIAGKRRGFLETRGTLFFDIVRILQAKKPRYCILENVKGLLSHDKGETFRTIITSLDELGYDLQWQVLNSRHFGVAQNRQRVFIVGHLRAGPPPQIFPIGKIQGLSVEEDAAEKRQTQATYSRILRASPENKADNTYIGVIDRKTIRETDDEAMCIDANYSKGPDNHGQRTVIAIQDVRPVKKAQNGKGFKDDNSSYTVDTLATQGIVQPKIVDMKSSGSKTRRGLVKEGYTGTLDTQGMQAVDGIRRLTPKECERLQGFPDDWTAGVSDSQRYKQLGNAVTVNVVYEVARRL